MSFNWTLFIKLAEHLVEDHNPKMDDAWIRTSVSRCYYGTYGLASDLIISKGINLPGKDTHKFVREKYLNDNDINLKKIGQGLGNLFFWRKKADYDKRINFTHPQSKFLLAQAKLTSELLSEMRSSNFNFDTSY